MGRRAQSARESAPNLEAWVASPEATSPSGILQRFLATEHMLVGYLQSPCPLPAHSAAGFPHLDELHLVFWPVCGKPLPLTGFLPGGRGELCDVGRLPHFIDRRAYAGCESGCAGHSPGADRTALPAQCWLEGRTPSLTSQALKGFSTKPLAGPHGPGVGATPNHGQQTERASKSSVQHQLF